MGYLDYMKSAADLTAKAENWSLTPQSRSVPCRPNLLNPSHPILSYLILSDPFYLYNGGFYPLLIEEGKRKEKREGGR